MIDARGGRIHVRLMTREEFHCFRQAYVPDPQMDIDPYTYDAGATDRLYDRHAAEEPQSERAGIFTAGGEVVGSVSIRNIDSQAGRCTLGIVLVSDAYKGLGYGTEAFSLAVAYAFEVLGLQAAYADTTGGNVRMQRILERLGFRCFLRMADAYDMGGRMEDRLDYVLTLDEYSERT